jgi:hypothetical protein
LEKYSEKIRGGGKARRRHRIKGKTPSSKGLGGIEKIRRKKIRMNCLLIFKKFI